MGPSRRHRTSSSCIRDKVRVCSSNQAIAASAGHGLGHRNPERGCSNASVRVHHEVGPALEAALDGVHQQVGSPHHLVDGGKWRGARQNADAERDRPAVPLHCVRHAVLNSWQSPLEPLPDRVAGSSKTNSSPPILARMSALREFSRIVSATVRRSVSPDAVPQSVVDGLEVVEVQISEGQRIAVALRAADLGLGHFPKCARVDGLGQRSQCGTSGAHSEGVAVRAPEETPQARAW